MCFTFTSSRFNSIPTSFYFHSIFNLSLFPNLEDVGSNPDPGTGYRTLTWFWIKIKIKIKTLTPLIGQGRRNYFQTKTASLLARRCLFPILRWWSKLNSCDRCNHPDYYRSNHRRGCWSNLHRHLGSHRFVAHEAREVEQCWPLRRGLPAQHR